MMGIFFNDGWMRREYQIPACMPMHLLSFNAVTKVFNPGLGARRVCALDSASFSIDRPGIVGFAGVNGAGKTTSIKLALGLLRPTRGSVAIRGVDASLPRARRGVAYVSEQPYIYGYLTVAESLRFTCRLLGLPAKSERKEIDRSLCMVKLEDAGNRRVRDLSKGMQQRLTMAQALLGDPDLFIFDEPMSGLDPVGRSVFRSIMRGLAAAKKLVFFSTHLLEDIESLCERVIALNAGRVVYDGGVDALLEQGVRGAEVTVARLPDSLEKQLHEAGVRVSGEHGNQRLLFVPRSASLDSVLAQLAAQGLYPRTVVQRRDGLHEALYTRARGENA